ncbi:hypothetical protein [Streptosporangium sp. NPDC000396]
MTVAGLVVAALSDERRGLARAGLLAALPVGRWLSARMATS